MHQIIFSKYIFFIIFQIILNLFLFYNYRKISNKINILDIPNSRKVHKKHVPLLGGLFLFINLFFLYLFDYFFLKKIFYFEFHLYNFKLSFIFITTVSTIFLLGLLDDKYNISYEKKLFVLLLVLFLNISIDEGLQINNLKFSFYNLELVLLSKATIFSILCFIIYLNAVNMFDGINLQTSITFSIIYIFFIYNNIYIYFSIFIIIYLIFFSMKNFYGQIFFGDSGTLLIGYLTGFLLVKNHNIFGQNFFEYSDYVVSFMLLPILDLLRQFINRVINGKNPFYPDDNHLHHRLKKKYNYQSSLIIIVTLFSIPIFANIITDFKMNIHLLLISSSIYFILIYITRRKNTEKV